MQELPPYTGLIGTGDQFIWAPPGYDFPPGAFAHIEVTDIVFNADSTNRRRFQKHAFSP